MLLATKKVSLGEFVDDFVRLPTMFKACSFVCVIRINQLASNVVVHYEQVLFPFFAFCLKE